MATIFPSEHTPRGSLASDSVGPHPEWAGHPGDTDPLESQRSEGLWLRKIGGTPDVWGVEEGYSSCLVVNPQNTFLFYKYSDPRL